FRAEEAAARLVAIASGARDPRPLSQQRRELYRAQNDAAQSAMRNLTWHEVARDELLDAARNARLVLFGEMHHSDGPLREAQRAMLRAMAGAQPVVLGFEPSVQEAQQSVLDLAAQLGVEVRSTETNWRTLNANNQYAERDDETATAINTCLAEDPARRLFVLRGEGHTLPGGYLCRQLHEAPLIVLTVHQPLLCARGDRLQLAGRTFRIGDGKRLYFCGVDDLLESDPGLATWLAERQRGGP
ncbi:MAG: hypothetical protein ABIP94_00040, partial [Planctomycetota bacterium]